MDATGLVSLETAVERLQALRVFVVLAGVQPQPLQVLSKADIHRRPDRIAVFQSMEQAVAAARERVE
jgi:anti-anti-sigma regulatory factor